MKRPPETSGQGGGRGKLPPNHSLFPELEEPGPGPTLPDPASRRAAILAALRHGDRLTHVDALARGWGWRLAADVFALANEHGWPIASRLIANPDGNPIAEY